MALSNNKDDYKLEGKIVCRYDVQVLDALCKPRQGSCAIKIILKGASMVELLKLRPCESVTMKIL
jgi:hypothetical protein